MQAKEILFVKSLLNSYMADATGQPLDKIEEDTDRDFFMTPEEAMEYGIIDEVRYSFPLSAYVLRRWRTHRCMSGMLSLCGLIATSD